ncbi:MAG: hypothetical protein R6W80_06435 [Haliea sp.]
MPKPSEIFLRNMFGMLQLTVFIGNFDTVGGDKVLLPVRCVAVLGEGSRHAWE